MKKFKYVFFIYLGVLLSIGVYVGKAENFEINIVDNLKQETNENIGVKSFAIGTSENAVLSVQNNSNRIVFEPIILNINDDKYIYNIELKNDSNSVVNTVINCEVSDNRYIDIYTDKNLYIINGNSSINAKFIIKLKNKDSLEDLSIEYYCSIMSTFD